MELVRVNVGDGPPCLIPIPDGEHCRHEIFHVGQLEPLPRAGPALERDRVLAALRPLDPQYQPAGGVVAASGGAGHHP